MKRNATVVLGAMLVTLLAGCGGFIDVMQAMQQSGASLGQLTKSMEDLNKAKDQRAAARQERANYSQRSADSGSGSCDIDMAGVQRPSYCPNSKGMDGSGQNIKSIRDMLWKK